MAAHHATVHLDYEGPSGHSNQNEAVGFIYPSNNVQAGGDYVTAADFALGTLDELYLTVPGNKDGSALSAIHIAVVRTNLPQRSGQVLIQYFSAFGTEATGDLSALSVPFIARGS